MCSVGHNLHAKQRKHRESVSNFGSVTFHKKQPYKTLVYMGYLGDSSQLKVYLLAKFTSGRGDPAGQNKLALGYNNWATVGIPGSF